MSTEVHQAAETVTTSNELDLLFGPLFDEYFNGENQVVLKSSAVTTTDASNKRQQQPDSTSSTSTLATTVTANGNFDFYRGGLSLGIQIPDQPEPEDLSQVDPHGFEGYLKMCVEMLFPKRTITTPEFLLYYTATISDIDRAAGGKLHDKNAEESWEFIENLALYDHEGWNDSRDFAKLVKAISLPHSTPKMPD
ncbi:hypothetical protein Tco_0847974 [Tanacetum coccineum]